VKAVKMEMTRTRKLSAPVTPNHFKSCTCVVHLESVEITVRRRETDWDECPVQSGLVSSQNGLWIRSLVIHKQTDPVVMCLENS
jgi:hypothetical protein